MSQNTVKIPANSYYWDTVPVIPAPTGDFYVAISHFTGKNGDCYSYSYAYAKNSEEFSKFCRDHYFSMLRPAPDRANTLMVLHPRIFGFYFGSQFNDDSIPKNFLSNCHSFNQLLTIPPSVRTIDKYFMNNCYSFKQPLTIPPSVWAVRDYFMYNCHSFRHLIVESGAVVISSYILSSDRYNFNGITITGSLAANWLFHYTNRDSNPYRNLHPM
jgi:hypothetical protein